MKFYILLALLLFTGLCKGQECSEVSFVTYDDINSRIIRHTKPINVGFDIDDTLINSASGFLIGKAIFSLNDESYLRNKRFWSYVNNNAFYFSKIKKSLIKIIELHLKHNDNIYFMTNRVKTPTENLSLFLSQEFKIPFNKRKYVYFKQTKNGVRKDKHYYIKIFDINFFYGDSDEDVDLPEKDKVFAVRVLRSDPYNKKRYSVNKYCEPVLFPY
ncbi:HAD family acid phosphatase [Dickeya dianthicola]|uniref:HAD family acid phosphatase n=1 Tax=Dickeya dianthicola TaxID=204039 RepID=UPI0018662298|nr:HAD family acid phosphatase [Dickeya dianthicola]QOL13597.1 hypothetical protein HGI48_04775 [Dickeya dianthicola]